MIIETNTQVQIISSQLKYSVKISLLKDNDKHLQPHYANYN